MNFDNLVHFSLQKVEKFIESKFRASKSVKMADFAHLESSTYTVWKYQDFSATQILREINFVKSYLEFLKPPFEKGVKIAILETRLTKIDFT